MTRPACMDGREYEEWQAHNQRVPLPRYEVAATPCHDCILAFALEMRDEGRCDGEPGGREPPPPLYRTPQAQASAMSRGAAKRERARQAAALLAQGMTQAQAARALGLKQNTVSKYKSEGLL